MRLPCREALPGRSGRELGLASTFLPLHLPAATGSSPWEATDKAPQPESEPQVAVQLLPDVLTLASCVIALSRTFFCKMGIIWPPSQGLINTEAASGIPSQGSLKEGLRLIHLLGTLHDA